MIRTEDGKPLIRSDAAYDEISEPLSASVLQLVVKQACEEALERLGVDKIDFWYCHRVDTKTPIEESMKAIAEILNRLIRSVLLDQAKSQYEHWVENTRFIPLMRKKSSIVISP